MEAVTALLKQIVQVFRWWVMVSPWEQGLRVRAGRHLAVLTPGVHLRIPYLDTVFIQSSRLRVMHLAMQTVLTKDRKPLSVGGTVGYAIADIKKLYETLHHAHDTIGNLASQLIAEQAAEHNADGLNPKTLSDLATQALDLERYGLCDISVRVTDFAFVRTYRLISDQRWGAFGGALNTEGAQP